MMSLFSRKRRKSVLVLVDFENLLLNTNLLPQDRFSLSGGFEKLINRILQDMGNIIGVFVFAPLHSFIDYGDLLRKLGFYMIACPKVRNKKGDFEDTTDANLIEFGQTMIDITEHLNHIYLVSGDKDFSPFIRKARRKGIKTTIVVGSTESLAVELRKLVGKRIIIFSTIQEN